MALLASLAVVVAPGPAAAADGGCASFGSSFAPKQIPENGSSLRVGCARDAGDLRSLAGGDSDLVLALDFDPTRRPEQMRGLLMQTARETQADMARGLSLSQALELRAERHSVDYYSEPNDVDFDGSVRVVGTSLVMVVPASDVGTAGFWDGLWRKLVVGAAVMGVTALSASLCLLAFNVGAPAAAPVCGAVSGALAGATGELLSATLDGHPIDGTVVGNTIGTAFFGAVGGALLGELLSYVNLEARPLIESVQEKLGEYAAVFTRWRTPLTALQNLFNPDVAQLIIDTVRRLSHGIGTAQAKVLPLGDSITHGVGTPGQSSYRAQLFTALQDDTSSLDFVGSQDSGQLADTDHEGHPGWRIGQIDEIADCTVARYRPNVVTLHIGTNDMRDAATAAVAPARLRALLERLRKRDPDMAVLVATLVPSTSGSVNARVRVYNAQIPRIVAEQRARGQFIRLVDMGAVTTADMSDSLHPNAAGYTKMAAAFHRAVRHVLYSPKLAAPVAGDPAACGGTGTPGTGSPGTGSPGTGTPGTGTPPEDGWDWQGTITRPVGATRDEVRFADLDGDGRDDYLVVDGRGAAKAWLNVSVGGWKYAGVVSSGVGATRDEVRFADLDGDGRDDYLVVDGRGAAKAWLNVSVGGWKYAGVVSSGVGATRDEVRFADLDGDGRDDYLVVSSEGKIKGWLNQYNGVAGWAYQGEVATGVGATRDQIRFADADGDGRDDYMVVEGLGQTKVWLNRFGPGGGGWKYQGVFASGVGAARDSIEYADIDGDGRDDYLVVRADGVVSCWLNDRWQ
ncbi:FG-GAP-like repeat-containing protein [Streptomyces sp. C10-9-1]|uniref:FG-GAP-like repeat-containing protein n=1 Tax=Streptomyces sp. C10-9-1 TaxID=1859285 RepID=UPI003F49FC27